jgi:hypothetical protein
MKGPREVAPAAIRICRDPGVDVRMGPGLPGPGVRAGRRARGGQRTVGTAVG